MAAKTDIIQIYRSERNGQYGWRYMARNGRKVAIAGETYEKEAHAEKMARELFAAQLASGKAVLTNTTR